MNEHDIESVGTWRIDEIIDQVIVRDGSAAPAGADEALVTELSGLSPIEWPADESGERIARMVASRTGQQQHRGHGDRGHLVAGPRRSRLAAGPQRSRPVAGARRSRWAAAGIAAAALVLAAVAVQAGPWRHGPSGGSAASAGRPASPSPSGRVTTGSAGPASVTAMRLVDPVGLFQPVAAASNDSNFLVCVTAAVCYSEGSAGKATVFERTADGGMSWHRKAAWPSLAGTEENTPSCPTTRMCAVMVAAGMAVTTDGFAHLRVMPVSLPPGVTLSGAQVSCGTADSCVVSVIGATGRPAIVYTGDGGRTWADASVPAIGKDSRVWQLGCGKNGFCIAITIGGTEETATFVTVLRSADDGRTWTASRTYSEPPMQTLQLSCGDGRQCMLVSDTGYLVQATATAGGRVTVRRQPLPGVGSHGTGTAVSCATARDCFVAATAGSLGSASAGTPASMVIEATHNGARSWKSLALPKVDGQPLAIVALLGCPVRAGCLGLAASASQFDSGQDRILISDLP
jgi:photosystem II stability/assembly factor-like uncharacterized protein